MGAGWFFCHSAPGPAQGVASTQGNDLAIACAQIAFAQIAFADVAGLPCGLPCDQDPDELPCRFNHEHQRRDGRPCTASECHAEHRAQLEEAS